MARPEIHAWSPSRLSTFESCPRKAYYLYVEKHKEPQGAAAAEGQRVHALAAQYVSQEEDAAFPEELRTFQEEVTRLRGATGVLCEQQQAFTRGMRPTEWFASDAWLRVIYDVLEIDGDKITITDYKTGKIRDKDLEQLELYACTAFMLWAAQTVTVRLWYVKYGVEYELSYTRDECAALWPAWVERAGKMLNATAFPPKPSPLCRWCAFSTDHAEEVDARYEAEGIEAKALRLCDAG